MYEACEEKKVSKGSCSWLREDGQLRGYCIISWQHCSSLGVE